MITGKGTSSVEVANISPHGFWLLLDEAEYFIPFDTFPWFKEAKIAAIINVERLHGDHIYWPDLDIDLELDCIVFPEKYPLIYKPS